MDILTVTTTNSPEQDCRRMVLTKQYEIGVTEPLLDFIRARIEQTEGEFREIFPRGMSYTIPYTEIDITPRRIIALREEERASAEAVVS